MALILPAHDLLAILLHSMVRSKGVIQAEAATMEYTIMLILTLALAALIAALVMRC